MNKYIKFILIISVICFIYSCATYKQSHTVYRTLFESDIPSLDPIKVGDTQSHDVAYNIYNGLVTYRPTITGKGQKLTDIVPDLAESWTVSSDGKTYVFKLKKGVLFHNGREFNAYDVKYSFERLANPKNASKGLWTLKALPIKGIKEYQDKCKQGIKASLEGIEVIDNYTVKITLEQMIPFALHVLAMSYYYIVPKEEVEKWGKDFTMHPVGTGPYMFKEWIRGVRLSLVKNPNYFEKGLPYIDELRYLIVPNESSRFMRFEKKEEEHHAPIPSASFDKILNDPFWNKIGAVNLRKLDELNDRSKSFIIKAPLFTVAYLGMDTRSAPFTDKKVRKAFNYAINKEKIIDRILNGRGIISNGVLPKGFPGYNPKRPVPYPYNPKLAKELLSQAGYKDSNNDGILEKDGKNLEVTFWHNNSDILAHLAASIQADLKEVGVKIDVRSMQWAPYLEKIKRNEATFFRMGWHADYPDPDNFLWTLFSTDNIGQDNHTRYSNPLVDNLLNAARTTNIWEKREKLYQKAEDIIIDDAPWIFLYSSVNYKIVQPYVIGQQIHPIIQNVMKIVKIEK